MTDADDRRIRELAREQRREDAARTPSFGSLWAAAQEQRAPRPFREAWWRPLAALTAAAAVVVVAVSAGVFTSGTPELRDDAAGEVSLTMWRAPSGDLLEIDGIWLLDLSEPEDLFDEDGGGSEDLRLPTDSLLGNFDMANRAEREM